MRTFFINCNKILYLCECVTFNTLGLTYAFPNLTPTHTHPQFCHTIEHR